MGTHSRNLSLAVLPERLAICVRSPDEPLPEFIARCPLFSITRTHEKVSLVLPEEVVPVDWKAEKGWRCFKVLGSLKLNITGVLASLTSCLADAGVSTLAISTFTTDYLLVR
ncbi:MAG: ACT domain-containing protein [Deltaproteobacteria bacterium]|nr:ACT domain-containing protein [Deltaproteobacteria bacterium]